MTDVEPQKAEGKVLWHFSMSLDGFVAGPNHSMDWLAGVTGRDGVVEEYTSTTGAVLGGRDGWDRDPTGRPYGGDREDRPSNGRASTQFRSAPLSLLTGDRPLGLPPPRNRLGGGAVRREFVNSV